MRTLLLHCLVLLGALLPPYLDRWTLYHYHLSTRRSAKCHLT